jgi:CPA1 family monovalent cation:H+ antiporter
MTWGGVRGGISVALALSLPENEYKSTILTVTYVVVVFSIIVQGLTIAPLVKRLAK